MDKVVLSFYCIIVIGLLSRCNNTTATQDILTYHVELKKNISYPFSEFMNVDKLVYLETNDHSLLKGIDRIRITNDYIFIFTNREFVKVFSHEGNYLYDIGKIGKGPQELLMATDFDVSPDNKKIAIWDRNKAELKLYKVNGDFIKSIKSKTIKWVFRVCWLKENQFLFSSINRPQNDKRFQIYMLDKSLNVIKSMIPFAEKLDGWAITGPVFTKDYKGIVHYRHPIGTEIYKIEDDTRKIFTINFGKYQLNKSDEEKFAKNNRLLFTSPKAVIVRYQELEKYIYCRYQFENRSYSMLINKNTKAQKRYNHSNPFDYSNFITIVGVYKSRFIGLINPYKLKEKLSKVSKSDIANYKENIEYWKSVSNNCGDADNPILVFLSPNF